MYLQGDDLWYKAYVVNGQNNKLIDSSKTLYVEFIDSHFKIKNRQTIHLENGIGNGDLKIPESLTAGMYRLRAYTNWMRNFNDVFIFEKPIRVISTGISQNNPLKIDPIQGIDTTSNSKKSLASARQINLQFFPEGGFLIDDVNTIVGIKAEDSSGRGISVKGNILASSGRKVAGFDLDSMGIGVFKLRPDITQQYHAEIVTDGITREFKIQKILRKGFALSVTTIPGSIIAEIDCNFLSLNTAAGTDMVIQAQHGGKTYFKQHFNINSKANLINIPDRYFPEGVACVTLIDDYGKPLSERLIYVHHLNNPILRLSTTKSSYHTRERVVVNINLTDSSLCNLSLVAVDASLFTVPNENILSYLSLRSEIKGQIEHPELYFDTTNTRRFERIDQLLLTQGWRAYIWQLFQDSSPPVQYKVEKGITITGKVTTIFGKKALSGMNVTMFAPKAENQKLFSAKTDSLGSFAISGAIFYGYQYLNFTSRRSDMISADGESKNRKGGWIKIDSLFQNIMPIDHFITGDYLLPKPLYDSITLLDSQRKKFSFLSNNELKVVQVQSPSIQPLPEIHSIGPNEQRDYNSLMHYLLTIVPGAHEESGGCISFPSSDESNLKPVLTFSYFPERKVVISGTYADNSKIDYRFVCDADYLDQPMINIVKVTIRRRFTANGLRIFVYVVLKPGVLEKMNFDNSMADITGYYKSRMFYSPQPTLVDNKSDYRRTLHWSPNLIIDKMGKAQVEFFNSDLKGKVKIFVEGVSKEGVPLAADLVYIVK